MNLSLCLACHFAGQTAFLKRIMKNIQFGSVLEKMIAKQGGIF
jgi:hypothetical protein